MLFGLAAAVYERESASVPSIEICCCPQLPLAEGDFVAYFVFSEKLSSTYLGLRRDKRIQAQLY
jgi:hypothetical protein